MDDPEAMLRAAEDVIAILNRHRIDAVVIGAVALAAYQYVRQTEDIDLGVNAEISALRVVVVSLREAGYTVELREPDGTDPNEYFRRQRRFQDDEIDVDDIRRFCAERMQRLRVLERNFH